MSGLELPIDIGDRIQEYIYKSQLKCPVCGGREWLLWEPCAGLSVELSPIGTGMKGALVGLSVELSPIGTGMKGALVIECWDDVMFPWHPVHTIEDGDLCIGDKEAFVDECVGCGAVFSFYSYY